jgi:hypothetical protein
VDAYLDSIAALLEVHCNGALAPLTDGLLILRHLFGFIAGTTLTTGASGSGCAPC